ncbi:MAG: TlpA disulfide reductase family protein [Candidatus Andeanibacterium colombiense]|uniref:TlpA disulfide reductase family protein n=1 Tax=Candidatus Andeanibacterium colombiense TaxID=3121345 RepID=A0AAJ6BPV7_9SPHN|nr:MAG: TlpA disulfide reductase family protein [Sphingomonadaceae bacterium]
MSRLSSIVLAPALGLALLLAGCDRESASQAQPQGENKAAAPAGKLDPVSRKFAGEALPAFTATDPSGKTLDLAGLKGQPVLLNLWATWCAPCKAEMPVLDAIAGANAGKLRVVTVSQDMKGAELVTPYFAEAKFKQLEPWLDTKSDLSFKMGASDLPTTILYNAKGVEVARVTGAFDWQGEEARALIAEAMGKG